MTASRRIMLSLAAGATSPLWLPCVIIAGVVILCMSVTAAILAEVMDT